MNEVSLMPSDSVHQAQSNPSGVAADGALLMRLREHVDALAINASVVSALIPNGSPFNYEAQLWDYKEKLPFQKSQPTEDDIRAYNIEVCEIIKDIVAFHNAFGGYIVFGIKDKGEDRISGCVGELNVTDLNKKIEGYTRENIECFYSVLPIPNRQDKKVGILLVPRRPDGATPVHFIKPGPQKANGARCFNADTYVRMRDECRPAAATSKDWKFLHSDRSPSSAGAQIKHRGISSRLPARDPDLIEFVGREDILAKLRGWLSDSRSPVRLVTGIGGLGKTSIAYRFCEEVADTQAGSIEWVLWFTAKQKTYSALRGQLVQTAKVDFSNLNELFIAILKSFSYEFEQQDEDPTSSELLERVVEAFSSYTCLVVIDDIDSLSPEDQREAVSALTAIAMRTVGREIPPTRILMTSRIDHGIAPTSVIKIGGLTREDFESHVANLCTVFLINNFNAHSVDMLFRATSGSPIFASSIVRLVRLGESLQNALDAWRGQEGEEVRRFAFEREIKLLDGVQSRLLYAVLLLGETSINDLSRVLDATAKVIRDRVSELQSYHLVSTGTKEGGDAVIFPPSDLAAVVDILRSHLGLQAEAIEKACARAHESSNEDNRSIGLGIRRIVSLWDNSRNDEAYRIAQDLRAKFPKSGDVANILGQALMKSSPPNYRDADREFETARQLGCKRPALVNDSIRTKTALGDWQGLFEFCRKLSSSDTSENSPLLGYLRASSEILKTAKVRADHRRAAELAISAVERISSVFSRFRLSTTAFDELKGTQVRFANEYIYAIKQATPKPGDKLEVFECVWRLAQADVILNSLVLEGLSSLEIWWGDVERRRVLDQAACHILSRQLSRIEGLERQREAYNTRDPALVRALVKTRHELAHRGAKICPQQ